MSVPVSWYLLLAAALFAIGTAGALTRRNGITIFLSIELMLNSVNLTLIAFSRLLGIGPDRSSSSSCSRSPRPRRRSAWPCSSPSTGTGGRSTSTGST